MSYVKKQTSRLLSKSFNLPGQAVHLCAALLLLGCTAASEAPVVEQATTPTQPTPLYRFSVQPSSPMPELADALQVELKRDPFVEGIHKRDLGQILISAMPNIQKDTLAKGPVPSFGRLAAKTNAFEVRVPYALSTYGGNVFHTGEIRYITEPISVISPTLAARPQIPQETWQDISSMLLTDALPALEQVQWQAHVVGIIDKDHAILNIGEQSGVQERTVFLSAKAPQTAAEIVIFERNGNGTSRAIIKHLSGPPLQNGMLLMPTVQ